jgi:hypothetical protein
VSFDEELMDEGEDKTFVFGDDVWFELDVFAYRQIDRYTDRTHKNLN